MVLYDWQRGKIPFFTLPLDHTEQAPGVQPAEANEEEGAEEDAEEVEEKPMTAVEVAAKELVSTSMADALAKQVSGRLPQREDYFMAEDVTEGEEEAGEEEEAPAKKKRRRGGRGRRAAA